MPLYNYNNLSPRIDDGAFVAPSADLIGDVRLAPGSSVWYSCALRADIAHIEVGENSNIQDLTVVHVDDGQPTVIGKNVTIGHRAVIHACTIGDGVLIGMGAIILNGAVIGDGALIAAGAVVSPGKVIPPGAVVMGVPGKVVKELTPKQREKQWQHAEIYVRLGRDYLAQGLDKG